MSEIVHRESSSSVAQFHSRNERTSWLTKLPDEVILLILGALNVYDLFRAAAANKLLYRLSKDDSLWRIMYDCCYRDIEATIAGLPYRDARTHWRDKFIYTFNTVSESQERWKKGECWVDTLYEAEGKIYCVDMRGSSLVFGDATGKITKLRANTDNELIFQQSDYPKSTVCDAKSPVYCLQGSSDNAHHVIAGCEDGTVQIWTTRSAKRLVTAVRHSHYALGLQFDNHKLISAGYDGTVKVYDFEASKQSLEMQHKYGATCVAFENSLVITGGRDMAIRGWDLRVNKNIFKRMEHNAMVWAVQMQSQTMVSTGFDGAVRVWDMRMIEAKEIFSHGSDVEVRSLAFDGSRILSGDSNNDIWVRSWDRSYEYKMGLPHSRYVSGIFLAPHYCITTSWDATVRLWTFDSQRQYEEDGCGDEPAAIHHPAEETVGLM